MTMKKSNNYSLHLIGERCLVWNKDYSKLVRATVIEVLPEEFWSIKLDSGEIVERGVSEIANIPTKPGYSHFIPTPEESVLVPFTIRNLNYELSKSENLKNYKEPLMLLLDLLLKHLCPPNSFCLVEDRRILLMCSGGVAELEFYTKEELPLMLTNGEHFSPVTLLKGVVRCEFIGVIHESIYDDSFQAMSNKTGLILTVKII